MEDPIQLTDPSQTVGKTIHAVRQNGNDEIVLFFTDNTFIVFGVEAWAQDFSGKIDTKLIVEDWYFFDDSDNEIVKDLQKK